MILFWPNLDWSRQQRGTIWRVLFWLPVPDFLLRREMVETGLGTCYCFGCFVMLKSSNRDESPLNIPDWWYIPTGAGFARTWKCIGSQTPTVDIYIYIVLYSKYFILVCVLKNIYLILMMNMMYLECWWDFTCWVITICHSHTTRPFILRGNSPPAEKDRAGGRAKLWQRAPNLLIVKPCENQRKWSPVSFIRGHEIQMYNNL